MLRLGLGLGLFSALLDMFRTRSPMFDRLQRRNNSHGLAKYSPTKTKFTHRRSNKPFLIRLSTTPSNLKYVATLPCNLLLMTCFADDNVSQGSVATYVRCGRIFNIYLTTNLLRNLESSEFFLNR